MYMAKHSIDTQVDTKLDTLEQLYKDTFDLPDDPPAAQSDTTPGEQLNQSPISEPIPLEAAAYLLGIPAAVLKEQVRQGLRLGFKRKSRNGKKWFLDPSELVGANTNGQAQPESISLLDEFPPEETVEPDTETSRTDNYVQLIRESHSKVEALTYRNGYLEAQLRERDSQIKLLTDRKAKQEMHCSLPIELSCQENLWSKPASGWSRFMSWLAGGKS